MRALLVFAALWIAAAPLSAAAGENDAPVDLELVLAVDNSLSVNKREFDLQIKGLAEAFRSRAVVAAILSSGGGGIAVALVLWSNHTQQSLAVPWTRVADRVSAEALADRIAATPRLPVSGGTGVGAAMAYALRLFADNGYRGRRRVIDVSGDGQNNMGIAPSVVRDRAVLQGVTVNGLVILDEEPQLDRYYLSNVIGGKRAFLEIAEDFDSFGKAVRRKLVREIAGRSLVWNAPRDRASLRTP